MTGSGRSGAHRFLGFGLLDQAKTDDAIAEFRKAVELEPKNALAHSSLGVALLDQAKTDDAIAEFRKAIEIEPKNADAHGGLGEALRVQGKTDDAIAEFRKAIELEPKNAGAHRFLGFGLLDQGKTDDAIAEFRKAVELDPEDSYSVLWLFLASTRSGAHTSTAGLKAYAKNLKQLDWPYPVVELFLGGRTPESTLAAPTKPDDRCEAQYYVGEWHLLRGDQPKAIAALKAAVGTCPKANVEYDFARAELKRLRPRP
jgi:lipoprotein NlpI